MFVGGYENPSSPDVFYLDTRCPDAGWKKGPSMSEGKIHPYAAVINGKLYVMGINNGLWGEFVVHTRCSRYLYLYDVEVEIWSLFDDDWGLRGHHFVAPCAVVDDIICCFSRSLHGYDLVRRRRFSEPVKGLEGRGVLPKPSLVENVYGSLPEIIYPKGFLVHLGNGKLCLVWSVECDQIYSIEIRCTKFRISKQNDGEEEHRLQAIIETFVADTIHNAGDVEDCLVLILYGKSF
ncbi:hypothetical protein F0562_015755 [Nyssa sinensis]|uniref:Uncharacterized protein n=1 Tax=Nyssa sinensis TaxID=561372 RepID=A0A5J4ZLF4_9ASTE|nr:hypothetical protein F0562_015755 [Nyssa sinensis]